jgi:hypothetical protein
MSKYILDIDEECNAIDSIAKAKGRMFKCLEDALKWISSHISVYSDNLDAVGVKFADKIYVYELYYEEYRLIAMLVPEVK